MQFVCYLTTCAFLLVSPVTGNAAEKVDFGRDIRPILSNHCFKCHGPAVQKGKLRLDEREAAIKKGAITPGKQNESELLSRITRHDSDELRMPPTEAGPRLTPDQIAKLKAWIDQGAEYTPHWAFQTPVRPAIPRIKDTDATIRNPIDAFIVSKLQSEGLKPSSEADKSTLIRRVTLDLTGLLPTPNEVEDYLKDDSLQAYEKW